MATRDFAADPHTGVAGAHPGTVERRCVGDTQRIGYCALVACGGSASTETFENMTVSDASALCEQYCKTNQDGFGKKLLCAHFFGSAASFPIVHEDPDTVRTSFRLNCRPDGEIEIVRIFRLLAPPLKPGHTSAVNQTSA